jgi:hypothetical protein
MAEVALMALVAWAMAGIAYGIGWLKGGRHG